MAETVPLQQTVFEQGPQATFVPPAQQPQVYQEGQVVFGQPIYTVDPGIAWDALGAEAAKTASTLFENTLDYLITSKQNGLAELKDKYEAQLNEKYLSLANQEKRAKTTGIAPSGSVINELLTTANNIKEEWKREANVVLENNKSVFMQPAIDYWDEKLDIKSLGRKYQQLAVSARSADRDISRNAQRLVFDAQLSGLAQTVESENFAAVKAGQVTPKKDGQYDRVASGSFPIPTGEDSLPIRTSQGLPLGYDLIEGRPVMRTDATGAPLFFVASDGTHTLNPSVGLGVWTSPEEVEAYIQVAQEYPVDDAAIRDQSMLYTKQGVILPDTAAKIKNELQKPENTQAPSALYFAASVVSKLPPDAVPSTVQSLGLTKEQGERLTLMSEIARSGGGFEGVSTVRGMQPKDITQTVRYVESLRGDRMLLSGGIRPEESFGFEQDVALINGFVLPVVAAAYGLSKDEIDDFKEQLEVEVATKGGNNIGVRDVDPTDKYALGVLLDQSPELKAATMHAMAFMLSNKTAFVDSSGDFDSKKLAEIAERFTTKHMGLAGMVRVYSPTGEATIVRNEGYLWMDSFLEGTPEQRPEKQNQLVRAVLAQPDSITTLRQTGGTQESLATALAQTAAIPGTDVELVRAMADELRVIITDNNSGINRSQTLSPDILLPLQVASHPNIMRLYGPPLLPNAPLEEKLARVKTILQDLAPLSEWGFGIDNREDLIAFSRSPNGGLPLGFRRIPLKDKEGNLIKDKDGKVVDLLKEIVPADRITGFNEETDFYVPIQNGLPVLSIPAYLPGSGQYQSIGERVDKERLAVLNGKTTTRLSYKDTAPASKPLATNEIISAATFAGSKEIMHQLRFADSNPIGTTDQAIKDIRLNSDIILQAAEEMASSDTSIKESLPVLREELALTGGSRQLFSDANIPLIVKEATAQGAKSMADVYAFMIGVAKARHLNVGKTNTITQSIIKRAMDETGIPIDSNAFIIPSGVRAGMIISDPNTQNYWEQLKEAANSGYSIYRDPTENTMYISKDVAPKTIVGDKPMDLLLAGKTNETAEEYNQRFMQTFNLPMTRTQNRKLIRESLTSFVDREYLDYTSKRTDTTVLPSAQKAEFDKAYADFRKAMKLDSKAANPRDVALAYNYDWPAYWRDNNSFPPSLENLPKEYVLQDKSIPIPAAKSVEKIRQTYNIPLNQTDLNKALSLFTQDYLPAESDTFDRIDMERVKQFKEAKWHPAVFEYQVRVMAAKKDTLSLREIVKNEIKPNKFEMDSVMKNSLADDWFAVGKELLDDTKQSEVYDNYSREFNKLMADPSYAVDFKKAYLLEVIAPSGRTEKATTKERRKQLLIDALNRVYVD